MKENRGDQHKYQFPYLFIRGSVHNSASLPPTKAAAGEGKCIKQRVFVYSVIVEILWCHPVDVCTSGAVEIDCPEVTGCKHKKGAVVVTWRWCNSLGLT